MIINDKYIWSIVYVHVRVYLERERGLREGGRGRQGDRERLTGSFEREREREREI